MHGCTARLRASRSATPSLKARCRLRPSSGPPATWRSAARPLLTPVLRSRSIGSATRAPPRGRPVALAVRPVQVDPYWQHGGHAAIYSIGVDGREVSVNDQPYAAFSREPDSFAVADFDNGDVVRLIGRGARKTPPSLRSDSGLLSAACEFAFSLPPRASFAVVVSSPMRDNVGRRRRRRSTPCERPSRNIRGRRSARERSPSATGR